MENVRVEVDGIYLATTAAHETAQTMRGPLLRDLAVLEISHKNSFEFLDGLVVIFNELRQPTDMTTDVDRGCGIWCLRGLEYSPNAFVGLVLLGDLSDHKSSCIERLDVFRRAVPLLAEPDNFSPVEVDEAHNYERHDVCCGDMDEQDMSVDVSDGEHGQRVPVVFLDVLQVVDGIDGHEYATGN